MFYTEQKHKENMNRADLAKGCINRMCVTDKTEELDNLLTSAILHITNLYHDNKERILEKTYGDKETRDAEHKKQLDELFK